MHQIWTCNCAELIAEYFKKCTVFLSINQAQRNYITYDEWKKWSLFNAILLVYHCIGVKAIFAGCACDAMHAMKKKDKAVKIRQVQLLMWSECV